MSLPVLARQVNDACQLLLPDRVRKAAERGEWPQSYQRTEPPTDLLESGESQSAAQALNQENAEARQVLLYQLAMQSLEDELNAIIEMIGPYRRSYSALSNGYYPLVDLDGQDIPVRLDATVDAVLSHAVAPFLDPRLTPAERSYLYDRNLAVTTIMSGHLTSEFERTLLGQAGVIANRFIDPGTCLGVYGGVLLEKNHSVRPFDNRFIFCVDGKGNEDRYIDGENILSLINTAFTYDTKGAIIGSADEQTYNVMSKPVRCILPDGDELTMPAYFSKRAIPPGTELRVDYSYRQTDVVQAMPSTALD
ncbi:SET domain-containing protein [Paraburkholderia solisilvae]|uniref:SET domain-containing protein n=1 Tax=Paraburkholderia solisilvae TaxID=624376 RepID=A0A6J5F2N5_9BURK|nr:SET domain-containing protein [Paraburkholderia solisilvae]CAB3772653.1 hypothetical protein LMG29739_06309 [Paraburkholderia solisilvae]